MAPLPLQPTHPPIHPPRLFGPLGHPRISPSLTISDPPPTHTISPPSPIRLIPHPPTAPSIPLANGPSDTAARASQPRPSQPRPSQAFDLPANVMQPSELTSRLKRGQRRTMMPSTTPCPMNLASVNLASVNPLP